MIIPSKIKIGGVTYSVRIAHIWPERAGDDGDLFYSKEEGNIIYIGADLSRQAQEITLIHEALHAMNSTMNHEFLDSLAQQLYQMLADNNLLK